MTCLEYYIYLSDLPLILGEHLLLELSENIRSAKMDAFVGETIITKRMVTIMADLDPN